MNRNLKTTIKKLNKIPNINRGGCGFSALAIYDTAKSEGKSPKIVFLYSGWDADSYEQNLEFKNGENEPTSCSHVVVKIGKKYYDSTGKLSKSELQGYRRDEEIKRSHLIAALQKKSDWNTTFKRDCWLNKIAKHFSKKSRVALTNN
jgi:hypothetical protein